jgi:dihydroxyacid dehydratase/phosphogluconate dehydratase
MKKNSDSKTWLQADTRQVLLRRALVKAMGYTTEDLEKPIVGIINTWAETNPGHYNFKQLAEAVKRGVWAAGGFPLEINTMSICEVFFDISSMIYRNQLAMTTEELIARHPFDGVVLIGSCDKNVPARWHVEQIVSKFGQSIRQERLTSRILKMLKAVCTEVLEPALLWEQPIVCNAQQKH